MRTLTSRLKPTEPWIEPLIVTLLSLAALVLYGVNLGGVALRDWDEGTVAQVAREIAQAPDFGAALLHPTLWGQPYANKPTLVHGLIALAFRGFGVNEWAARLPGALISAIAVPLVYGVGRELWGQRLPALWGAIAYLTWLPVVRHGRLAMLDGVVVTFCLVGIWGALLARRNPRWALVLGLGIAGIGLTKGLIALLILALLLGFWCWDTPRLVRGLWPGGGGGGAVYVGLGLGLGLLPLLGWYAAQWSVQGQGFVYAGVVNQALARLWQPVEGNSGPPWYYLWELLKSAWPWLMVLPWGLAGVWGARRLSWGRFLLLWCGGYSLVISCMGTKLPWYIQPLYLGLALAVGPVLAEAWQRGGSWSVRPFTPGRYPLAWSVMQGLIALGAIAGGLYVTRWAKPALPELLPIVILVGLSAIASLYLLQRQDHQFVTVLAWGWYLALVGLMLSPHWVWELGEDFAVKPVAALIRSSIPPSVPPSVPIYSSHPIERPSLNFYSGHRVIPYCKVPIATLAPSQPLYFLVPATLGAWQPNPALGTSSPQPDSIAPSPSSPLPSPQRRILGQDQGWLILQQTQAQAPKDLPLACD